MGQNKKKRGSRGTSINIYKEKNEILKLERRNKRYLKECELKMVSTMCKSTDEDEQQGVKINKDGYQTHFKAQVSEKIYTEGNFENDKLDRHGVQGVHGN